MPRHSRNSTGSATGEEHAGSLTTIAAITQAFPNAIFFPPCADPSYAHRACATFLPHRRKNVPPAATVTGPPPAHRCLTIRRATATPRSSASHAAWEKNQHARRNRPAIPAAAAIATTVRRLARTIPHASAMNSAWVERRLNTGASSSSRARQVAGTANPVSGSPACPGGPVLAPPGQLSSCAPSLSGRDGKQHIMADWPAKEASQSQMI